MKNTISPPEGEGLSVTEVATDSQPTIIAVNINKHTGGTSDGEEYHVFCLVRCLRRGVSCVLSRRRYPVSEIR